MAISERIVVEVKGTLAKYLTRKMCVISGDRKRAQHIYIYIYIYMQMVGTLAGIG